MQPSAFGERLELQRQLIRRPPRLRRNRKPRPQPLAFEDPEIRGGVADINRENHFLGIAFRICPRLSGTASENYYWDFAKTAQIVDGVLPSGKM